MVGIVAFAGSALISPVLALSGAAVECCISKKENGPVGLGIGITIWSWVTSCNTAAKVGSVAGSILTGTVCSYDEKSRTPITDRKLLFGAFCGAVTAAVTAAVSSYFSDPLLMVAADPLAAWVTYKVSK